MSTSYEYIISNGHHIAVIEGKNFLIDTGSPISFSLVKDLHSVHINGSDIELDDNMLGIKKDKIDDLVGLSVDGFIGTNILIMCKNIVFDKVNKKISFNSDILTEGASIPMRVFSIQGMGVCIIPMTVKGEQTNAIFDTGAWVGYASKSIIGNSPSIGEIHDYGPQTGGDIVTTKHRIPAIIGYEDIKLEVGKMNMLLEMTFGLLGYKVIIGINDLPCDCVKLDFKRNQILLMDAPDEEVYLK